MRAPISKLAEQDLMRIYGDRQRRYADRDVRLSRIRSCLKGDLWNAQMRRLGTSNKEPVIGNIVLSTVRVLAQRVGKMPRLHAVSRMDSETAKTRAEKHEQELWRRLDKQNFEQLLPQAAYWLIPSGFQPFTLTFDKSINQSRIRIRDPLTCYPSTVWPHEPGVEDCLFAYRMTPTELAAAFPDTPPQIRGAQVESVLVGEYHSPLSTVICVLEPEPFIIAELPNLTGRTQVYIARDLTPDFDFYGQFDQVLPIMEAEARLMALMEAYAEQQVTAETVIVGEVSSNEGNWASGLGAINVLEPAPNASVQKLTNNMSPQVFQHVQNFERQQRITGSIPSSINGEPQVSFATGRGIEKLEASVDENVGHYQNILSIALKEIFNAVPAFEGAHGGDTKNFAPDVVVYPQFMAGTDPATNVALLQRVGAETLALSTAMEQDPLIQDPQREESKIQVEKLEKALLSSLEAQAGQGQIDYSLYIKLIRDRKKGTPLEDALEGYFSAQAPPEAAGSAAPGQAMPGGAGASLNALLGLGAQGQATGGIQEKAAIA